MPNKIEKSNPEKVNQSKTRVSEMVVADDRAGQRIDNFLLHVFKNVPKSFIYKLLRKGAIKVNGKRIKVEYKLESGDLIRLPAVYQEAQPKTAQAKEATKIFLKRAILFEDEDLIVLNKPSGMAVHGGSGINLGVIEVMRQIYPDNDSLELVHRLDRDTSGCLILAKKRSILRELHELFQAGKVRKNYLLLARGGWEGGTRKVDESLKRHQLVGGERMVRVEDDGKMSTTIFHPGRHFPTANCVLLEAELRTGRTHQIRVHAAHIGHPVAGDEKYGDRKFNLELRKLGLKRLFLHAATLNLSLKSGKLISVKAPLPHELKNFLVNISG
jgi:23S rRNA pseudouridine955/2504/2580 synthase